MGQKVSPIILRLGKTKIWKYKYCEKKSIEQSLYTFKNAEIRNFIEKFFKSNNLILNDCRLNYSNNTLYIFISYYLVKSYFLINKLHEQPFFIEKFTEILNHFINKKEIKIILIFKHLNKEKYFYSITKSTFVQKLYTKTYHHKLTKKEVLFVQKKVLPELRFFEQNFFFNAGLNIFFTLIKDNGSAELLAKFIASQLKLLKKNQNFFLKFIKTALTIFLNRTLNSKISGIKIKIKGKFNKAARAKHKIIIVGNVPLFSMTSNVDYSEKISYSRYGTLGVKVWTYQVFDQLKIQK